MDYANYFIAKPIVCLIAAKCVILHTNAARRLRPILSLHCSDLVQARRLRTQLGAAPMLGCGRGARAPRAAPTVGCGRGARAPRGYAAVTTA